MSDVQSVEVATQDNVIEVTSTDSPVIVQTALGTLEVSNIIAAMRHAMDSVVEA